MRVDELVAALIEGDAVRSPGLRKGLGQYVEIQKTLLATGDVADAPSFQRSFGTFYRVRRNPEWRRVFFVLMQQRRRNPPGLQEVLRYLAKTLNRCELSFSSKLAATLNPDLPLYDEKVRSVLQVAQLPDPNAWRPPTGTLEEKLLRAEELYRSLGHAVGMIKASRHFAKLISAFDEHHGETELTDTKKLDLVMWQSKIITRVI